MTACNWNNVKELFEAALDLEPLNPACRSPGLIHSGEVIAVLDAYYAVSERMDIRGFFLAIFILDLHFLPPLPSRLPSPGDLGEEMKQMEHCQRVAPWRSEADP